MAHHCPYHIHKKAKGICHHCQRRFCWKCLTGGYCAHERCQAAFVRAQIETGVSEMLQDQKTNDHILKRLKRIEMSDSEAFRLLSDIEQAADEYPAMQAVEKDILAGKRGEEIVDKLVQEGQGKESSRKLVASSQRSIERRCVEKKAEAKKTVLTTKTATSKA